MLIGGGDIIPLIGACRVIVCLHLHTFPPRADWRKSEGTVDGEPQGNWRWNSNSLDVVASSPSFSCPPPERPGELSRRLILTNKQKYDI